MCESTSFPASRTRYHHGDLRQALKTLALALITEHGADGLSLRQAAASLGVAGALPVG